MKNITLHVRTLQKAMGEEPIEISFVTEGKLYHKDDTTYIIYDETEISGLEDHKTTLKIKQASVTMQRFGRHSSRMYFEVGNRETSKYKTPYGNFKLEILTHIVDIDIKKTDQQIHIEYALAIHGLKESNHILDISFAYKEDIE